MKTITISVVGEASIKENKVVVDYTELKELVAERDVYKEALETIVSGYSEKGPRVIAQQSLGEE